MKKIFCQFLFFTKHSQLACDTLKALSDNIKERQDSKWTQIEQFNYLLPILSVYLGCASLIHRKQLPNQLFLPIVKTQYLV